MTVVGEDYPVKDSIEILQTFVSSEVVRMQEALVFLTDALPIVGDLEACNERLREAGWGELCLSSPVPMMVIQSPFEVYERCNNFMPNFGISTGSNEVPKEDSLGNKYTETKLIPITETELDALASGEIRLPEDYHLETEFQGWIANSHADKPAFMRMLVLFPEFTKCLVLAFSEHGYGAVYERYGAELFAAYQVMSRLVDQNDRYVVREGQVDEWYLCR